jgi:hypothetical protein
MDRTERFYKISEMLRASKVVSFVTLLTMPQLLLVLEAGGLLKLSVAFMTKKLMHGGFRSSTWCRC